MVYGSDIDHAVTASGKPYSALPNAFKYRTEMVAGCTCNGKDPAGLAAVSIEKDPTLRKSDIVAGSDGLMIANPGAGRNAELNFTPVPEQVRARFRHAPVMAREWAANPRCRPGQAKRDPGSITTGRRGCEGLELRFDILAIDGGYSFSLIDIEL